MSPLISFLIPAYQAAKTIERCLLSIQNQTEKDFEVIVIDDGSADETYKICEVLMCDSRYRLFTQDNIGIAATRQRLLGLAKGRYIQFVDADDWIELTMVAKYKSILDTGDYDIIISDYIYHDTKQTLYKSQKPTSLTANSLIRDISSTKLLGVLWNKLIRRDIICDIKFPALKYCEDWCICKSLFESATRIIYTNTALYHYDNSDITNSLTRNINKDTFKNRIQYIDYLQSINFDKYYPKEYDSQVASIAYTAITNDIYSDSEFKDRFRDISFWNNYNTLYKRLILTSTRFLPLSLIKIIDTWVRKAIQ